MTFLDYQRLVLEKMRELIFILLLAALFFKVFYFFWFVSIETD